MKQRVFQVITSLLLIITLTMANFLLLGLNIVSYAAEEINADKKTNHKNIEFMAYFKDDKGNKITEMDAYTNNGNLKLYFQISVKQEGYFNGNIVLSDANFKLKTDNLNEGINKIENNVIYLKQINAGESRTIEVDIELLKEEQFDLNLINKVSKIFIEGVYRDSTQKDISIKAERKIVLKFVSPYINAEESIVLSQKVITNKILSVKNEEKRVIQIQVNSGLNNNLFPINKTTIKLQTPKISDKYPEEVLVNSNNNLITNGKELLQNDWNYDKETGLVNINIENKEENNKVSWIKTGEDKFIVTYIFDKEVEINNKKLTVNSKIELYDLNKTVIEAVNEITLTQEEKNSIVTTTISQYETNIYKGRLYEGIARDITYKNVVDINLNSVANEINIKEEKQEINSVYKTTKINKAEAQYVLGEEGSLEIINAETGKIITEIDKNTKANENGDIVTIYPNNVTTIVIKLVEPEKIGKLEIETTKTIEATNRDIIKNSNSIEQKALISYVTEDKETNLNGIESKIDLKETETFANLEISRTEISTMTVNNNVEFRITLNSKTENNELFKNPVLRLELPEKIQDIQVNSIRLLYEEELKIKTATLNNNVIEIALEGEQTKYKEQAIDGAMIIVDANLTTSTKIPSSTEQIKLTYTNEKVINYKDNSNIGKTQKDINIVSYVGVVTTNQIAEYGIDVVNNEGTKDAKLSISSDTKNVKIEKKIINNNENKIKNVKILGVFPTKEASELNNIDIQVEDLMVTGVDVSRIKIYYSNNSSATEDIEDTKNDWTESLENPQTVKKYLVVINELDILEEVDIVYNVTIPANLEYNESAEEGYNVYYENAVTAVEERTKLDNLRFSTGVGPAIDTTLKAYIGTEELSEVKEGEIITYEISASNTGSEDITDVQLLGNIPDNTIYIEKNKLDNEMFDGDEDYSAFNEYKDKQNMEIHIEKLAVGETKTINYQVRVKDGTAGKIVSNSIITKYGEVTKTSNKIENKIKVGELQTTLYSADTAGELKSGYLYRYVLELNNKSNKEKKDINVNFKISDVVELKEIYYITEEGKTITEKEKTNININSIKAGETVNIAVLVKAKTATDKEILTGTIFANIIDNDTIYNSNVENITIKAVDVETKIFSNNSDSYVKAGNTIEYSIIVKNNGSIKIEDILVENNISNKTSLVEVTKNGEKLLEDKYSKENDEKTGNEVVKISDKLDVGEQSEYKIKVIVNRIPGNSKSIEILNNTKISANSIEIDNKEIKHVLEPENEKESNDNNDKENDNKSDDNNTAGEEADNNTTTKAISGTVWVDENENGQKDSGEQLLSGVIVKLLNVKTNSYVRDSEGNEVSAKTNENGFYSFDKVGSGEYIVIFEYDTSKYILTTYKKGETDNNSSKVINRTITINGQEKTVGSTEVIKIDNDNIANINMGLQIAKNFDLKLDKYITKVVVQNSKGTSTNEYDSTTFAKAEIDAKLVNSTTAVVEYTIKITNVGEVDAYAKKIADYISKDYKFTSDLNKDWYQSGDTLYNSSLANEKIKPGESKEIKLIVTKRMTENNTGLVHNIAEITESYNELGLKDENDNNTNSADLILSIKTGQVVTTITLILSTIIIIGAATYIIARIVLNKKVI